ncbi:sensor histidine kinase [Nocardia sp. NPDC056000]|uniref:sensor histidine kinase n=1 Tax=Nocardia sp. NPDC056000 TaxID=3345674 RepID=UPI0035D86932
MSTPHAETADARRLGLVMDAAFYVLLAASLARFLIRHHDTPRASWVIGLSVVLAVLYALDARSDRHRDRPDHPLRPWRTVWFGSVVAVWAVLVVLGPSFAWCAVPLLYLALRILPLRIALPLAVLLTGLVVVTQVRLAGWLDPNVLLAPPAVAAIATAVFVYMRRQTEREAALERREGMLEERGRLAMEIHDTLAQGLSSQRMLLQAAELVWEQDSVRAREHVRTAAGIADRNLAEARRFVHDLAPAELAENGSLIAALGAFAARETGPELAVDFQFDGAPAELPARVESTLLRIAQGALANVREHAGAANATITLTYLGDQVALDIADDGCGFDPERVTSESERGHGLPAIRARVRQFGGAVTIESAPGEGTVLSAAIPLERS